MLNTSILANDIQKALTANLNDSNSDAASKEEAQKAAETTAKAIASAIEKFIKAAEVEFKPGTVSGATPANGSLVAGQAKGGKIV